MSSSLSPHGRRPSHSRKPSISKSCDYGSEHVSRLVLELAEDEREKAQRQAKRDLDQKNKELLEQHNELAALQDQYNQICHELEDSRKEVRKLEQDIEDASDEYNKLADEFNAEVEKFTKLKEINAKLREEREELKVQISELSTERDTLRLASLKRERSPGPDLEEARREAKQLKTESQDLRKRITILETVEQERDRLKKELEEANRRAEIKQAITPEPESDLTPLSDLHPALAKNKGQTAKQLADALIEAITFDLNDIWSHLPNQQEAALVTPSTRRLDVILNRLKEAVKKDANLKLLPKVQTLKDQVQDLKDSVKEEKKALKHEQERRKKAVNTLAKYQASFRTLSSAANHPLPPSGATEDSFDGYETISPEAFGAAVNNLLPLLRGADFRRILLDLGENPPANREDILAHLQLKATQAKQWKELSETIGVAGPVELFNKFTLLNSERAAPETQPVITITNSETEEQLIEARKVTSWLLELLEWRIDL